MRVWVAAGLVIVFANTAHARQEAWVEVGGGAGYAQSLHGDLGFGDAAVSGTARVHLSPHVAIEGQAGW